MRLPNWALTSVQRLSVLRQTFPEVPVIAVTGTRRS